MHAPVRNTTFAALVTAGLFAVGPAAHADTVSDDHGPVVGGNEWEPLVGTSIRVCGDSIALLEHSAVCSAGAPPARAGAERPVLPDEPGEAPHRCGAEEHCPIRDRAAEEAPVAEQPEEADSADETPAEPVGTAEPGPAAAEEQPSGEDVPSGEGAVAAAAPEGVLPQEPSGAPRIPEPVVYPEVPKTAAYALTGTGSHDAPLLTAGVATVLLGGVAIYVGYGLGRSDRPNLFR
ncbi:hypothetical protein FOF52_14455 [Thermobifida alba]|uniref:Uncharacterized protein n=1 Tax=Thermobifida alba TaxID=53522 RepID=A0ABY4L2Y2_THEAE|nr:hypothetical protein [Thermobifida alba]UPT22018.1 hypothetical protein FOF52_14455 [Thermobifida alba]